MTVPAGGVSEDPQAFSPSASDCCLIRIVRPGPVRLKRESSLLQLKRPGPIVLRVCSGSTELEEV